MILIEELFKVHILLDFNGHATQSSVSTNLMFSQSFFMHQCCNTKAKEGLVDHPVVSEFMGKTFQAAQLTHEIFFTMEVDCGSSVWQISKKYFAGVIYG